MLKNIEIEHQQRVPARGFEERFVPIQFWKIVRTPLAVEQLKQFALGVVAWRNLRRSNTSSKETQSACRKKPREYFRGQSHIRCSWMRRELFHSVERISRERGPR